MNAIKEIQVVVFESLPAKIKGEIAANHEIIYSRDFDEAAFTARTLTEARDAELMKREVEVVVY